MTRRELATSVVMADLDEAATRVLSHSSPSEVRRSFTHFVGLSQKLTSMIRSEFSALTGCSWKAADFDGWNPVTSLLKALRNTDEHEHLIAIELGHAKLIPANRLAPEAPENLYLEFSYEQDLPTQLADAAPDSVTLERQGAGQEPERVEWSHHEYKFLLKPLTPRIEKALQKAGTREIPELTRTGLATLREYHNFYLARLQRHGIEAPPNSPYPCADGRRFR